MTAVVAPSKKGLEALPEVIISSILTRLPILDAVRTSLLSSAWRNRWNVTPDLIFNHITFPPLCDLELPAIVREAKAARAANTVLLLRGEKIRRFEMSPVPLRKGMCWWILESWMAKLAACEVKQLVLRFDPFQMFEQPDELEYVQKLGSFANPKGDVQRLCQLDRHLVYCHDLTSLELTDCALKLPDEFQGFPLLKDLTLRRICISSPHLGNLISNCPELECFLLDVRRQQDVAAPTVMSAPMLRCFEMSFIEESGEISLDAPNLSRATFSYLHETFRCPNNHLDLNPLLHNSGNLEELRIIGAEFFALSVVPVAFGRLKCLHLEWSFYCSKHTEFAMYLLTISPLLETLHIFHGAYRLCNPNHVPSYMEGKEPPAKLDLLEDFEFSFWDWSKSSSKPGDKFISFVIKSFPAPAEFKRGSSELREHVLSING